MRTRVIGLSLMVMSVLGVSSTQVYGQQSRQTKQEAVLLVDGVVREIFRSDRQGQVDLLVQVSVERAELGQMAQNRGRVYLPAPGEDLYVHVQVLPQDLGHRKPPQERSRVRMFLYPRAQGGWQGAFPDWYEVTSSSLVPSGKDDPLPPIAENGAGSNVNMPSTKVEVTALELLGIDGQVINAGGDRVVVQITRVDQNKPGSKAGLEVGDVIIGAAKTPLTSLEQLTELIRDHGPVVPIVVYDKNTNQAATVNVDFASGVAANAPSQPRQPEPAQPPPLERGNVGRIGAALEALEINGKPAWKVTSLTPGGPAQTAGIEQGDFIVAVQGYVIEDLNDMNKILEQAGNQATLTIRDVRSGRSVPVEVALGGTRSVPNAPNLPMPNTPTSGLGIRVESVDVQEIPTLRVSDIQPGSAAERAGLRRGDIIESVNDTIVFNPEHFNSLVNQSRGSVQLVIRSGNRRSPVTIPVGNR